MIFGQYKSGSLEFCLFKLSRNIYVDQNKIFIGMLL